MPRFIGPIKLPGHTSLGVHIRALWWTMTFMLDALPSGASERRVRIRTHRAALERAYRDELSEDVNIAQAMAEEDGDAVSEAL